MSEVKALLREALAGKQGGRGRAAAGSKAVAGGSEGSELSDIDHEIAKLTKLSKVRAMLPSGWCVSAKDPGTAARAARRCAARHAAPADPPISTRREGSPRAAVHGESKE